MYTNFARFPGFYPSNSIPVTQIQLVPWIKDAQEYLALCKATDDDTTSYLYPARGSKPVLAAALKRDLFEMRRRIEGTSMSVLTPVNDIMYKIGLLPFNDLLKWSIVSLHSVSVQISSTIRRVTCDCIIISGMHSHIETSNGDLLLKISSSSSLKTLSAGSNKMDMRLFR